MIQISNSGACLHGARGGLPQGSTCQGGLDDYDDEDDYERYLIFEGEVKTRCETERWIPPTADRMGKTLPGRH